MTLNVAKLRVEERVRFDPVRLEALCHDLGEDGAVAQPDQTKT